MTMRKKDYEAIAELLVGLRPMGATPYGRGGLMALDQAAYCIAEYCATQDPTFKRDRFLADCGVSQ